VRRSSNRARQDVLKRSSSVQIGHRHLPCFGGSNHEGPAIALALGLSSVTAAHVLMNTSIGQALAHSAREALGGSLLMHARSGSETGAPATTGTRLPYQEFADNSDCSGGCGFLNFNPVPTGKRLEVSSISCRWYARSNVHVLDSSVFVYMKSAFAIVQLVPTFLANCSDGSDCSISAANHQTFFFVGPGRSYYLRTATGGLYEVSCTVAGEMVSL
jgi:hypothetical protein